MNLRILPTVAAALVCLSWVVADDARPDNPAIDIEKHLRIALEAAEHREERRVTEEQFVELSRRPGTIVLDARSKEKYDRLHVRGAINLSFPDIAFESLAAELPDKSATILIYCNNNFEGDEESFPRKDAGLSLNLSTYAALYGYGYRNIYELAPLIEIDESQLAFDGSAARPR